MAQGIRATDSTSNVPRAIIDPKALWVDIDPPQWAGWFDLLAGPSRSMNGVYILHADGKVLNVTPAYARKVLEIPAVIEDPRRMAAELYAQWKKGPVTIVERTRAQSGLHDIQAGFVPGDDLFTFLIKTKDQLFQDAGYGVVIYPQPWENWRRITPEIPPLLAETIAPKGARASALIAVYDGGSLFASVLIGFEDAQIRLVTTVPQAAHNGSQDLMIEAGRLLAYAKERYAPVAFGLLCSREQFTRYGLNPENWESWLNDGQDGKVVCLPGKESFIALVNGLVQGLAKAG